VNTQAWAGLILGILGVLITGLGLVFTILSAVLAVLVRVLVRFTRVEDRQSELMGDVRQLVEDKAEAHRQLATALDTAVGRLDARTRVLEDRVWENRQALRRPLHERPLREQADPAHCPAPAAPRVGDQHRPGQPGGRGGVRPLVSQ